MENVIHGNRRTVEFSFPIGINEETRVRKTTISMNRRVENIGKKPRRLQRLRAVLKIRAKFQSGTERMITKGYYAGNSIVKRVLAPEFGSSMGSGIGGEGGGLICPIRLCSHCRGNPNRMFAW